MTTWSLQQLLEGLDYDIERRLATARQILAHTDTKGDATEHVWLKLLQTYLPKRYEAETAHIVDSKGRFSEQIDIVVFDRQYSPFVFVYENQMILPAESVYAVFEVKQTINASNVKYAQKKVASVRRLYRTSLPIPSASGVLPPKVLSPIISGLLTLESDWNPPMDKALRDALNVTDSDERLDLGCVAAHGMFAQAPGQDYTVTLQGKPATGFLLELIARLQDCATVPMIDVRAYAQWLRK